MRRPKTAQGFGPPPSFTCAQLEKAFRATSYGGIKALAAELGVTYPSVELSMRSHRRCGPSGDRWRLKRREFADRERSRKATEKEKTRRFAQREKRAGMDVDCRSMLKALRRHGTYKGAARELGVSNNKIKFAFFGQKLYDSGKWTPGPCADFADRAARALPAGPPRARRSRVFEGLRW